MRRHDEPVFGDPSLPASATITMTHRYGRVLSGYPLALVCVMRNLLLGFVPFTGGLLAPGSADDQFGPPEYLILRDRASGRRIARLALGRDDLEAHGRRLAIEYDLDMLGREQFLKRHVGD